MRYELKLTLLTVVVALFIGCLKTKEKDDSPIVAKVNDESLTLNQLKKQIPAEYLNTLGSTEKQAYVEQWIRQQLLYQMALDEKLDDDAGINARLRQFEQQLLADEILQRKLESGTKVSDEEAKQHYDKHSDEFMREEVEIRISHIVVSDANLSRELRQRLQAGEDFGKLAKEFSEDQTRQSGGDLGYFSESESTDELTQVAFKLKLNDISQPIKTAFGYHLVKVTDRQDVGSIRIFEDVKRDIINNLSLEKQKDMTTELLTDLEKNATIVTHPELLEQLK